MTEQLDLLLVNPNARAQVYGDLGPSLSGIEPPLWCGLLAAFIRERGYSVRIIDAEAENWSPEDTTEKIVAYNPVVVAVIVLGSNPSASSTPKMTATGELLRAIRKKAPHIQVIIGGLHPSALPEQTLREEEVEFVCQGEGFHTIFQLLEALKSGKEARDSQIPGLWYLQNGKVVANLPAPLVNPDELPIAAWDLLPMEKYRAHNWHCFENIDQRYPYALVYSSLGCPFDCSYCNIHALYDNKPGIRFRSPEKIMAEINYLVSNYEVRNLKFLDELFAINEDRVIQLCDLIIQSGHDLNIWAYARIDTVTEKMLAKMKQAGINWVAYGFESASELVREGVAKKTDQNTTKRAIEMTQAAGINILGNFIYGLPDDNLATMQETLDMAKEFNFEYVNFYIAMAYPGSQLYEDAVKQGIQLPEKWHGFGQYSEETLPMPTKYLSAAEVLRFRDSAFKEYFTNSKYLKMIKEKFGSEVVGHIEAMLNNEIHRKYA